MILLKMTYVVLLLSVVCETPLEVAWLPWLRYDLGEGVSLIVIGEVAYLPYGSEAILSKPRGGLQ